MNNLESSLVEEPAIEIFKNELGWEPRTKIDIGLKNTLNWYLND